MLRKPYLILLAGCLLSSCATAIKPPLLTSCSLDNVNMVMNCFDELSQKAIDIPVKDAKPMVCRPVEDEAVLLQFCVKPVR